MRSNMKRDLRTASEDTTGAEEAHNSLVVFVRQPLEPNKNLPLQLT
jgi:hypothetical protein